MSGSPCFWRSGKHTQYALRLPTRIESCGGRGTVRKIPGRFQDQHALEGKLNVHSVEEICPEKLRSLLQRREPRDLYDIWRLLGDTPTLDREQIGILFREKCEFREIDTIPLAEVLGPNAPSLENLWTARLSQQKLSCHTLIVWSVRPGVSSGRLQTRSCSARPHNCRNCALPRTRSVKPI
jgi:nucleotidyltransferase AbiEii toxin of type IV toxin-antitoxin system